MVKNLPANAGNTCLILLWEDSTCQVVIKPVHHNYWACALESVLQNKRSNAMQEMRVQSLRRENPLEEEMATHSSILA